MKRIIEGCLIAMTASCMVVPSAEATVALAPLFGNNMVLQRGKPVPVAGTAAANKAITVTFNTQTKSTTSDTQGNWQLALDAMVAKTSGGNLTATETGANTVTLTGAVVGDVWLCSGQSNAAMDLNSCNRAADVSSANFPGIRHLSVPMVTSRDPLKTLSSNWSVCSSSTAGGFSAIGFYFARKIYQDQAAGVPIGIITSSIGGTNIDIWLAPEGLSDIPVIQPLYTQEILPWGPFSAFNGMVHPLAPYGVKGMIWYQGENREVTSQSTDSYYLKEKALQQGWKRLFGLDDFAFYVVQIANWLEPATSTTPDALGSWSDTRQMQAMVLNLPHAGMASALDIGEAADIHPKDKLEVGERLALWALKNDYGQPSLVASGPILRDVAVSGSKLVCSFDHVGSGLMVGSKTPYVPTTEVVGGTLQRFVIAGATGSWYAADAVIVGNTVEVSSPSVATPRKVAYAYWINPAGANLYNKEGLPASPFYIDDATAAGHFTITATAGAGGSISPAGTTTVLKRATALYTITPDAGSFIKDVKVDGVSVGSVKYYPFDPVYANHTITATFDTVAPSYTVTTTGNASGTILPAGPVSVAQGGTQTFKMIPNSGCRLISVTVDGAPVGNRTSVTFADVRTAHAVAAVFAPIPTPGTGTGLRGDYYIGSNFETFKVTRTDPNVNFDWGLGSPNAAIPIEGFTARWSGEIQPQFTETCKFYLTHDDGVKLWVNNQLLIDRWSGGGTDDNGSISLVAGTKYTIKLEYVETTGNANCKLEWYSPSLPREVVPQSQLFPASTPIHTLTSSAGANGSFSPSGAVLANSGGSQTFSVIPAVGYFVAEVKVDSVSVGAVTSYTFSNVTANHTISATFAAMPSYAVSGKVTSKTTLAAIAGAKVNFYTSASFIGPASYSATTDAAGNYSVSIPMGTWSVNATATSYFNSATQGLTVSNAAASNINFALANGTRNIPRTSDLLFSVVTDSLPASGSTGNWATYQPAGQTLTALGTPTVETIMGRKWEKNIYADNDAFRFGSTYSTAIPCTGASIVLAAKPTRSADSGNWRSLVDIFYDRLVLGITNDGGKVCVRRNGSIEFSNAAIPDGQVTILTMIVQTDGSYNVYANGSATAILSAAATGANSFISLDPKWNGGGTGFWSYINVGRNEPDGWTTTNGYIGDVFVYKTALSASERQTLETDMLSKFITGGASNYTINATAGTGGTINPAGSTAVNPGSSQTFTITPNPGYKTAEVSVDGVSQGIRASYTFSNVTAPHTISATFTVLPTPSTTLTRHVGTGSTTTYGDALSFDVTVSGTPTPTGTVTLKDGGAAGTSFGTGSLVGGTCTISPALNALSAGSHDTIVAVYSGDSNFLTATTSALSSQSVSQKPLTVTGAAVTSKSYDGTRAATVTGTLSLSGVVSGDPLTPGNTTSGSFADKHAGPGKVVSTAMTLAGTAAANYLLTQPSLTGEITPLALTVAAVAATKTYDGTTAAAGTPTLTPPLPSGDTATTLSQAFQTKHAGTGNKEIVPSVAIDDGNGGDNYTVTLQTFTTGTITPLALTVAAVAATKTYDGTTAAAGTPTLTPPLPSGDTTTTLSQAFETKDAGEGNKVIVPDIVLDDGNGGANYAVTLENCPTGTIHQATATVTLGDLAHAYDGSPKSASATTDPAELAVDLTYDGAATAPSAVGTYAVVATINDVNHTGSTSGTLVIAESLLSWRASHFTPEEIAAGLAADDADPDGDGCTNLAEFAFNGDPCNPASSGLFDRRVAAGADGNRDPELTFTCAVRRSSTVIFPLTGVQTATIDGITYTIQGSLNLAGGWDSPVACSGKSDTPPVGSGLPDLTGTGWEYRTFSAFNGLPDKGFLRARVAAAP
ncbi:MAG: MBG domain-containing protein [Verrucomicrobia bacterium]|nr:MBG domain-containing protein [Verrucomicrobiota bacterium]